MHANKSVPKSNDLSDLMVTSITYF
jgi:hypothetical protein